MYGVLPLGKVRKREAALFYDQKRLGPDFGFYFVWPEDGHDQKREADTRQILSFRLNSCAGKSGIQFGSLFPNKLCIEADKRGRRKGLGLD